MFVAYCASISDARHSPCLLHPRSWQSLPKDNVERISYVLRLYDKMLDFLLSHGAHLAHVSARFLLNYDDYLLDAELAQNDVSREPKAHSSQFNKNETHRHFVSLLHRLTKVYRYYSLLQACKRKPDSSASHKQRERLSRRSFYSRNKQCWLDVVLQTHKCFVLAGIHEQKHFALPFLYFARRPTAYRESRLSSTLRYVVSL